MEMFGWQIRGRAGAAQPALECDSTGDKNTF